MRTASKLLGIPVKVFSSDKAEETQTNNYLGFSKENKRFSFEENGKIDYLELGISLKEFNTTVDSDTFIEILDIPNYVNTFQIISSYLELNNSNISDGNIKIIDKSTEKELQEILIEKDKISLYELKSFYSIKIFAKGNNLKIKYIAKGV